MTNLAPGWAKMAPKKPPNVAKMEMLVPCWDLLGSTFDHLRSFLDVKLHIEKPLKTSGFHRFFVGLGSRVEAKSEKIWSRWQC